MEGADRSSKARLPRQNTQTNDRPTHLIDSGNTLRDMNNDPQHHLFLHQSQEIHFIQKYMIGSWLAKLNYLGYSSRARVFIFAHFDSFTTTKVLIIAFLVHILNPPLFVPVSQSSFLAEAELAALLAEAEAFD